VSIQRSKQGRQRRRNPIAVALRERHGGGVKKQQDARKQWGREVCREPLNLSDLLAEADGVWR